MSLQFPDEKQRQRAPSKRSLETRTRILDAAERLFAEKGFEGASLRDIAAAADVRVSLVHHHGGSKDGLFHLVVARRAEELSHLRLTALDTARATAPPGLEQLMACFLDPYLDKADHGEPGWRAYARLVAMVSSEERWRNISEVCFDPAAAEFIAEISRLFPAASRAQVSTVFVFCVAAMLALCTSQWRIDALGDLGNGAANAGMSRDALLKFCCAGITRALSNSDV